MKVVLTCISASAQLSGVSRHIANVARCLLTQPSISDVHLIVAPWEYPWIGDAVSRNDTRLHIHSVPIGLSNISRNLWFYVDLPAIAAQLEADVVHLAYPSPLRDSAFHCPTVVSLHDLYPYDIPENFGFPKVFFNRLVLQQCLRAVDAIACVSDTTLQQLNLRFSRFVVDKAVIIYNSVEPARPTPVPSPLPQWNGEPFLLCIAQHRRNKNIPFTLRVFERLLRDGKIDPSTMLVIIGVSGPETPTIHKFIRTSGLERRAILLSGIRDVEMQWAYRHCGLLLAPSIVEGFGLPVAEALLAGCPVVCSDIAAFRELGGSYCHYVPLGANAEEDFAKTISKVLSERRRFPAALPHLSAPTIAEEYIQLYRSLNAQPDHSKPVYPTRRINTQKKHVL